MNFNNNVKGEPIAYFSASILLTKNQSDVDMYVLLKRELLGEDTWQMA